MTILQLAINVLEFITRIGVNLSTSYHVPLTDGGYKKPSFYLGTSFPKLASDAVGKLSNSSQPPLVITFTVFRFRCCQQSVFE
jgi:hypothetical protein